MKLTTMIEKEGYKYAEMLFELDCGLAAYKIVTTNGIIEDRAGDNISVLNRIQCNKLLLADSIDAIINILCEDVEYCNPEKFLGEKIYSGLKSLRGVEDILMISFAQAYEPSWDEEFPEPLMIVVNIDFKENRVDYFNDYNSNGGAISIWEANMFYNETMLKKISLSQFWLLFGLTEMSDYVEELDDALLSSFEYDDFVEQYEPSVSTLISKEVFEKSIQKLKSLGVIDLESFKTNLRNVYLSHTDEVFE